ncbi:MAG TPA: NAD(P)-dependent oxidoreductase [Alphaproteobacteria bacterium]|nr:NAD(P)-dependent oxidoreductase [Alphaproteobacteria bacterium]
MANVSFLGLGVMGFPMAGHLARTGHTVTVYNRTAAKSEAWAKQHKGTVAHTPEEAAKNADFILACVGNDDDLRGVTTGEGGAFHGMKPGTIFIDHTTTSATVARELYAAAKQQGCHFIDAPVSGGQAGAEKGTLTVMAGGDEEVYAKAEPVMAAYSQARQLIGPNGSGQLTKMVNQICLIATFQGLSEGLSFAKASGLDTTKVLAAISKGIAGSWILENRSQTMLEGKFDFGFAVDWMRKDLGICLEEARHNGALLPGTAIIDQFYGDIQKMGGGRLDASSLILRLGQVNKKQ